MAGDRIGNLEEALRLLKIPEAYAIYKDWPHSYVTKVEEDGTRHEAPAMVTVGCQFVPVADLKKAYRILMGEQE